MDRPQLRSHPSRVDALSSTLHDRNVPMPPFARAPVTLAVTLAAIASSACVEREQLGSELGRQFALRLCPAQADCGCEEDLLIPDCERQVERELAQTEQAALDRGFVPDHECMDTFLAEIERSATCERLQFELEPSCPVYTRNAEVGEPCEHIGLLPLMMDCAAGLSCIDGICRDVVDPPVLSEGETCSDTTGFTPTGYLGRCDEHLVCDSQDTRTCIPSPYWPELPLGGECSATAYCEHGSYCRPQGSAVDTSEDMPGRCTEPTAPGEPCRFVNECTTHCDEASATCALHPVAVCGVLHGWWDAQQWLQER